MEKLEYSLPSYIVIGPFFVRVQAVRQALIKKRKFLANALLENLALMLSKEIEDVSHLFGGQKSPSFYFSHAAVMCQSSVVALY